ncbi:hypothetical protein WDU94_000900 [Cyamophila willieti]
MSSHDHNISAGPPYDVTSWTSFFTNALSEHHFEINDSLGRQRHFTDSMKDVLKHAILDHLDTKLDVDSLKRSLKSLLHDMISDHIYSGEMKPHEGRTSEDSEIAFQDKIRHLNAPFDIDLIKKELDRLCTSEPTVDKFKHRLFESTVNEKLHDEYNLEYADMTFLEKSPKNFIIFNKPGIDSSKLAKKLHEEFGIVPLDPKSIIESELSHPSEVQEQLVNDLRSGRCIHSGVLFSLILKKLASQAVKTHGYILSGIPMFRFADDGSELSLASEQFSPKDQLEQIFGLPNRPNIIVYLFCPDPCLVRLRSLTNTDSNTGYEHNLGISRIIKMRDILNANESEPSLVEEGEEEVLRNELFGAHPLGKSHDTNPKYPDLPDANVLNCMIDDYEDASEHLTSPFRSVKSQNLISNVGIQTIKYYHNAILPLINEYVLSHDPQYYIKLDGRFPTRQNLKILQHWLAKLYVGKPCIAYPLFPNSLGEEEEKAEEEEKYEEEGGEETQGNIKPTDMDLYKAVRSINRIQYFDWELSKFGTSCPVCLFQGTSRRGKTKLTATYLSKVYFLHSKKCLHQFLADPKGFVKEPNPKPTYKIIINGFIGTNQTDIVEQLCTKFFLKNVNFDSLIEKFVDNKRKLSLELFKSYAKDKVHQAKMYETIKKIALDRKVMSWKNKVCALIKSKIKPEYPEDEELGEENDHGENIPDEETLEPTPSLEHILNNSELSKMILENHDILDEYIPSILEEDVEKELNDRLDELVNRAFVNEFDSRLSLDDIRDAIIAMNKTNHTEQEYWFANNKLPSYKGWVLDGLPLESSLWNVLKESGILSNEIVFLYNSNDTVDSQVFPRSPSGTRNLSYMNNPKTEVNKTETPKGPQKDNGLNRKQLALVQESCLKFGSLRSISIPQIPSSIIGGSGEEEVEEEVKTTAEEEIQEEQIPDDMGGSKKSKHIQFKSTVQIVPFSDKFEYYETNDRILSNWADIKSSVFFNDTSPVLEIDVRDTQDIVGAIENHLLSKYSHSIIDMSVSNNVEDEEEESKDGDEIIDPSLLTFRDLGDTLLYCPVSLKENKQLIKGNTNHAIQYRNKTYYFKSFKNKEKFMRNPNYYVHFKEPLSREFLGPLKICVLSSVCVSGEHFCKQLAQILNVPFIDFNYVFERDIVPPDILPIGVLYEDPATRFDLAFKDKAVLTRLQELRDYFNNCAPLPGNVALSVLVDRYWKFQHPCKDGFLYYRFPHTISDLQYLFTNMFLPDVIIELKVPGDQIPERIFDQVKLNWLSHKGAIKKKTILYDQDIKLKYDEARKRVFHFVLNTVWSRELAVKEGKEIETNDEDILERIEAEIEFARGNADLLNELMLKYTAPEMEEFTLEEDEVNRLFHELEKSQDLDTKYSSIKHITNPLHHTPSVRNIAVRYGLNPEEIDLNVLKRIHKIVCQIVPKPSYKIKTLKQKINSPDEDLVSTHQAELYEIGKIKRVVQQLGIPWITSIPSEFNVIKCEKEITENLELKDPNVFESVYEVDVATAEKLLEFGFFYLSKYGRLCPIEIHYDKNKIQPFEKRLEQETIYCIIHRKYIYFVHGENNADKFKKNILDYVKFNSVVNTFSCPVKIAIIGPVKSGKSTLARALADYYDLEVITAGSAVRYVKKNLSWTLLADHIDLNLVKGCAVPDALLAKCIEVLVHVGKAPVNGYILDGVISKQSLLPELMKLNIVPHLVIQVNIPRERIFSHLKQSPIPERMPLKYSPAFIDFKLNKSGYPMKYEALANKIREYWDDIVITVDSLTIHLHMNKIKVRMNEIFGTIWENFFKMKSSSDAPVALKHMRVSPYEYETRLHCVIENCCVGCIVEKKQFVSKSLDRSNSVLFKNNYFWLCPDHYEPFMKNPEQFFCNLKPDDFIHRPRKIVINKYENGCRYLKMSENKGFCNVCFWNSFPLRIPSLHLGLLDYAVLYRSKLFLFCSNSCMQQFCLRPEFYHDKPIHCTLPLLPVEQDAPIPTRELPLVGYLHVNLGELLEEALRNVARLRPKYPFMSPQLSAALYMGYYLSAKVKRGQACIRSASNGRGDEACITNTGGDAACITNTFDDQFTRFLTRVGTVRELADTLPWDYNPFLIGMWLRGGKTDESFRRNLKTKNRNVLRALEKMESPLKK